MTKDTKINKTAKWFIELIQDFDGMYSANLNIDGKNFEGLEEYVPYNKLAQSIYQKTGIKIKKRRELFFSRIGRKRYAYIDGTKDPNGKVIPSQCIIQGYKPKFN